MYSGKDLDAFNFAKTCHREIKVTLKLSTYTVVKIACVIFEIASVFDIKTCVWLYIINDNVLCVVIMSISIGVCLNRRASRYG